MKLRTVLMSLVVTIGFMLLGCGGGSSSGSSGGGFTGSVKGTVTNISGKPLADIVVTSGTASTTTDKEGKYQISLSQEGKSSVSAKGTGYTENTEVFEAVSGQDVVQDIVLAAVGTVKKFNAADGDRITDKGAEVVLPAGAYEKGDGSSYDGKVVSKVTYNRVTTEEGRKTFPGTFVGEDPDTGEESGLQSYGFMTVELEAENGDPLKMNGADATIKFPPDPTLATPADGDEIPLWYFDTEKSTWIEQGKATYHAATNFYEGTVSHFTTWNLDKKFDGATVNGCIVDSAGARVPLADIYVSAPGWIKSFTNDDANGEFKLINAPTGVPIAMRAVHGEWMSSEVNVTLSPNETYDMNDVNNSGCLVLDQNASAVFVKIKGKVVDKDNVPIGDQYISFAAVDIHLYKSVQSDENGSFFFSMMRSGIETFSLSTYYEDLEFNQIYTLPPAATIMDVGTLTLATVTVQGCVTLESNLTSLLDGSVRNSSTGRTTFGTYARSLKKESPTGLGDAGSGHEAYGWDNFDDDGHFEIKFIRDNLPHKIYAHLYDENGSRYIATGMRETAILNQDLDLGSDAAQCIQLHTIADINQSAQVEISTTNPDGSVGVMVQFTDGYNWDTITSYSDRNKTVSFNFDRDGLYTIGQIADWDANITFQGSMTLETGGQTYSITIPDNAQAGDMWTAFEVEVYDGSINVLEVNMGW